jgi:enoyl-[acyl-carrier protein] reductase II
MGVGALKLAVLEGDEQNGCFLAGQTAGMVKKEQTAEEIITEMWESAKGLLW